MNAQRRFSWATGTHFEREAVRRLPGLIADLLECPEPQIRTPGTADPGWDARWTDVHDREWYFAFKSSGTPGLVARAAEALRRSVPAEAIPILVVPFMTPAGTRAASELRLSWIDLSGNAHVRGNGLLISREGRPNAFVTRGRPASAFAPVSARVARWMLADPRRWWLQKDLATQSGLDPGRVSRIVGRLSDDGLLDRRGRELRPANPDLLLDAWSDAYRFDRHDVVVGHASGGGIELARSISDRLDAVGIGHALTGLAAAWLLDRFAAFRLTTIYVEGDPHEAAERLELRQHARGANVQVVGPDDLGVLAAGLELDGVPVVSPAQAYLDLLALPERAREAAEHLRSAGRLWPT